MTFSRKCVHKYLHKCKRNRIIHWFSGTQLFLLESRLYINYSSLRSNIDTLHRDMMRYVLKNPFDLLDKIRKPAINIVEEIPENIILPQTNAPFLGWSAASLPRIYSFRHHNLDMEQLKGFIRCSPTQFLPTVFHHFVLTPTLSRILKYYYVSDSRISQILEYIKFSQVVHYSVPKPRPF